MLPQIIHDQIDEAEAAAAGMRDSAGACTSEQDALRARLLTWASRTDDLVNLARWLVTAAKLNHDTILNRKAS